MRAGRGRRAGLTAPFLLQEDRCRRHAAGRPQGENTSMNLRTVLSPPAALVALAAAPAVHADTMLSGHAGKAFAGDLDDSRTTYGGALTFMGDGAFGFEIEGAYTPEFFGDEGLLLGE